MLLITSGAYLEGEFVNEVGLIPPSFLPIGNRRLFEYQIPFLKDCSSDDEDIYLSIPSSYKVDTYDIEILNKLGANIIKVPDGLSLGNSIIYCSNATGKNINQLTLLHGDTLFLNSAFEGKDIISIHSNRGYYKRASLGQDFKELEKVYSSWSSNSEKVISGFFRFSYPLYFLKSLVEEDNNFIKAIVKYHQKFQISLNSNGEWLDFGHINSFFHSRTRMTTQRVFNELAIDKYSVSKSSKGKSKKIYAEGSWFDKLPYPLRLYTPALLGLQKGNHNYQNSNYEIEYLYLLPLSDLYVFSRHGSNYWEIIFDSIYNMLNDFSKYKNKTTSEDYLKQIDNFYLPKTLERLKEFYSQHNKFDFESELFTMKSGRKISLKEVAVESAAFIKPIKSNDLSIYHGDLCFSNILFDGRVENIKCIDPRGMNPLGDLSIYGDRRYDLAKLYHSIVGLYDFIIANRFELIEEPGNKYILEINYNKNLQNDILEIFRKKILQKLNYSENEILAITVHLFLSMLPLHIENKIKQKAFIANSLRLYERLMEN